MSFKSLNPHDPSDVVGEWEAATADQVLEAVARARDAAKVWSSLPATERSTGLGAAAASLERRGDEVTALVVREVGKPLSEARGEVARAVSILRYYSQLALLPDGETMPAADPNALLMARRRPVGVAALITPWNFPIAIPVWKAAPSLAYGNATILKPSSAAAAGALLLEAILASHLPENVFQVVLGGASTVAPMLEIPEIGAVSFTGSVPVGMAVARAVAGRGGRVQAEMGGQNPSVVLADADLDRAAANIAYASMGYAGQKCTATSRVIVEADVYDEFRDRLVVAVEKLQVLDPANPETIVGPLIDEETRTSALAAVGASGGRVITGGAAIDAPGNYLSPTLVELPEPVGILAKEEVFAPVAAVIRANSPEQAIAIANDVEFGLVAALFTSDLSRALRLTNIMEAGMVRVNAPTSGVDFNAPFGGSKGSSLGPREQGLAAREFYTESRTVLMVP